MVTVIGVLVGFGVLGGVDPLVVQDQQVDRVDQMSVNADGFLRRTAAGAGRRIYIVDCGIAAVPDIAGRLVSGFTAPGLAPGPSGDHGTQMATIAAGVRAGVAPGATIINVKVCPATGVIDDLQMFAGLDWILTQPVGIVNISLDVARTSGNANVATYHAKVGALTSAGFSVVAAAGNSGRDVQDPGPGGMAYPAAVPSAVTVANVQYGPGTPDTRASDSNYGAAVDLFAPGQLRAYRADSTLDSVSGTSGSAALVSGTFAAAGDFRPTYTSAQIESFVRLASRQTPVVNSNSPNASGQLFTDLGTLQLPAHPLPTSFYAFFCFPAPTNVTPVITAIEADAAGNYYLASIVRPNGGCQTSATVGPVIIQLEKRNSVGAVSWQMAWPDPNWSNSRLENQINDIAISPDGTRVLIAVSTSDTGRFAPTGTYGTGSGNLDAFAIELNANTGATNFVIRVSSSADDQAKAAFYGGAPEKAFIGGVTTGSVAAGSVSGLNDAFIFSRDTSGGIALAQTFQPGEVVINDGVVVNNLPVLAGGTNRDPFTGFLLSEFEAYVQYYSSGYLPIGAYFNPASLSEDEVVNIKPAPAGLVLSVLRNHFTWWGGFIKLFSGYRSGRLQLMTGAATPPTWSREYGLLGSLISRARVTPEDVYWLAGPQLIKVSLAGDVHFVEPAPTNSSDLSFFGSRLQITHPLAIDQRTGR